LGLAFRYSVATAVALRESCATLGVPIERDPRGALPRAESPHLPTIGLIMIVSEDYIPTPAQTDAVLAFLPTFENREFVPSRVESPAGMTPYHVFADELTQFHRAVYENGFVFQFDWRAWQEDAIRYCEQPELLVSADFETLRKLITFHVRAERYVEGHLPRQVESGHLAAILRRLGELRHSAECVAQ